MDPFDGYPYLVTRIGHTPLRHITLLPKGWRRGRLVELARRQRDANRLDICLALGPAESIFFDANGIDGADDDARPSGLIPWGLPVTDRLATPEWFDDTAELIERRARLARYSEAHRGTGYLVGDGLEGGRPASSSDIDRLAGLGSSGFPPGLARCPVCDQLAGEFLAVRGEGNGVMTPRVIEVHCQCANHNRCAACGEPLAESRLSAYRWSEPDNAVRYLAAYVALSHRCQSRPADPSIAGERRYAQLRRAVN